MTNRASTRSKRTTMAISPKANRINGQGDSNEQKSDEADRGQDDGVTWVLRLYVAGQSPKSVTAFANLKKICEQYLAGKHRIEIIDLIECPQIAREDQILAIPTLVRRIPEPVKKIIGDLSNTERTLAALNVRTVS